MYQFLYKENNILLFFPSISNLINDENKVDLNLKEIQQAEKAYQLR